MTLKTKRIAYDTRLLATGNALTLDQKHAELIESDPDISPNDPLPIECLEAFTSLWEDKGVQWAMLKGNEYALHDNLS